MSPLAQQLRTTPTRSISTGHLVLLRDSHDLQARMGTLGAAERRLPGGASELDLRRLAAPAVAFAQHVPAQSRALEVSLPESLTQGLMLVPNVHDGHHHTKSAVGHRHDGPARDDPPAVQQLAGQLSRAADQVEPTVGVARADLARHNTNPPTQPARQPPLPAVMSVPPEPSCAPS